MKMYRVSIEIMANSEEEAASTARQMLHDGADIDEVTELDETTQMHEPAFA